MVISISVYQFRHLVNLQVKESNLRLFAVAKHFKH